MSKNTKSPATCEQLITEYRKLGSDMKALRESHIADIEKLIVQYKKDKAALQAKREALLAKIREPKADKPATDAKAAA